MSRLTKLTKPLTRRIGRLVVMMTADGIALRGYGRRKGIRRVSWAQVASLAGPEHPAIRLAEKVDGRRELARLGAAPDPRDAGGGEDVHE